MSGKLFNALNYLVPASGSVRSWALTQNFTTKPANIDWAQISNDAGDGVVKFVPSGVFIDNRSGTTPLVILINELNYTIACAAGGQKQAQYPAPINQTVNVSGGDSSNSTVIFVDFPVIPFENSQASSGTQTVNVIVGSDTTGQPLPINLFTLPQSFTYSSPGKIATTSYSNGVNTWTQTLTYSGNDILSISGWVKT